MYYGISNEQGRISPCIPATIIPYRGAWLEYETDANDVFYVRIDKNRKTARSLSLIRAIGVGHRRRDQRAVRRR